MLVSTAMCLVGLGILAGPAAAVSLNPDAGSPGISESNTLHWILFIVIVIAIVVVNLAILRASRPRHRAVKPESEASALGKQLRIGLGLGVVALAIFVTATIFSDKSNNVPSSTTTVAGVPEGGQLEIRATGQQWLWRFDYPEDNGVFTYRRLVVPTGVTVKLDLKSSDVIHGWNIPSLTGQADAIPGKTNTIYFRADDEGVYGGESSILNGQGYSTMTSEVEAVSPDEYTAFLAQQKSDIEAAQDSVEKNIARIENTP